MAKYVMKIGEVSKVKLHGHIDASIAPELMNELKTLIARKSEVKKLFFYRRIGIYRQCGNSFGCLCKTETRRRR